jgi:hypothetical protein
MLPPVSLATHILIATHTPPASDPVRQLPFPTHTTPQHHAKRGSVLFEQQTSIILSTDKLGALVDGRIHCRNPSVVLATNVPLGRLNSCTSTKPLESSQFRTWSARLAKRLYWQQDVRTDSGEQLINKTKTKKLFAAAAMSQACTRTSSPTGRRTSSARLSSSSHWQPNERLPTRVSTTTGIPHLPRLNSRGSRQYIARLDARLRFDNQRVPGSSYR